MALSKPEWEIFGELFSKDRLVKYLRSAKGDQSAAIGLLQLDMLLAADLMVPLHVLELTLRNAIHAKLTVALRNSHWLHSPGFKWRAYERNALDRAIRHAERARGRNYSIDDLLAQLSLGFWVRCFSRKYEHDLWHPYLKRLFPDRQIKRHDVHVRLERLRLMRNQVAHHEPVLPDLAEDGVECLQFVLGNMKGEEQNAPATLRILDTTFMTIAMRIEQMRELMNNDSG